VAAFGRRPGVAMSHDDGALLAPPTPLHCGNAPPLWPRPWRLMRSSGCAVDSDLWVPGKDLPYLQKDAQPIQRSAKLSPLVRASTKPRAPARGFFFSQAASAAFSVEAGLYRGQHNDG